MVTQFRVNKSPTWWVCWYWKVECWQSILKIWIRTDIFSWQKNSVLLITFDIFLWLFFSSYIHSPFPSRNLKDWDDARSRWRWGESNPIGEGKHPSSRGWAKKPSRISGWNVCWIHPCTASNGWEYFAWWVPFSVRRVRWKGRGPCWLEIDDDDIILRRSEKVGSHHCS